MRIPLNPIFLSKGILISGGRHILKSIEKPDLDVFSDSEREILEFVAQIAYKDGGQKLLNISHEEQAFKKTEPLQLISYDFSKALKFEEVNKSGTHVARTRARN